MSRTAVDASKSKFIRDARCTNDVSWYKNYDTLTKDVASVFMSRPNGVNYPPLALGANVSTQTLADKQGGILINKVIPWFGSSQQGSVPVAATALNTAASKLYYYVVHGNSRNVSYDKGDLMRVLMTYDSIYCALHEAIRAYKFIKFIRVENKWATTLLECLGWDPNDLKSHVVQFRTQINLAIQRLNQLSLPDIFAMHKCHAELFDYVYRDKPGEKSQYMANVPAGFWMYFDEYSSLDCVTEYKMGTSITINVAKSGRTVEDFTKYINFMLHTIYDSTDVGVIQADIRKAFQNNNFITMYMLEEDPDVPIVFDEEYNLKVHNMEIFGMPDEQLFTPVVDTQVNDVKSIGVIHDLPSGDPNMITMLAYDDVNGTIPKESGAMWRTPEYADSMHIMDLPDAYREDVDSVLLMQTMKTSGGLITKAYWHVGDGAMRNVCYPECGAVIVAETRYYGWLDQGASYSWIIPTGKHNAVNVSTLAAASGGISAMHMLWELSVTIGAPVMITDGTDYYRLKPQLEVDNVTVYSNDVLRNILNVIVESLWYARELYNGTT